MIRIDQTELDPEELKKILDDDRAFQLRRAATASASAAMMTTASTRSSSPAPTVTLETPSDVIDVSQGVVSASDVAYSLASQGPISFRPSDFYRNMMYANCSKVTSPINEDIECIDISSTEDEESIDDPEEDFVGLGPADYGADGNFADGNFVEASYGADGNFVEATYGTEGNFVEASYGADGSYPIDFEMSIM